MTQHHSSVLDKVIPSFHLPSLSGVLGIKAKIQVISNDLHQKSLLTPDPNDDKVDFLKTMYDHADKAMITHFAPEWFKDFIVYITLILGEITNNAVHKLLEFIYSMVSSIVLWTPEFIFSNEWFPKTIAEFTAINIGIVVIFTMIEGLKKIIRMNHTPFREILKKLPIALAVSAATPLLFTKGVHYLNKLTHLILNLSKDEIGNGKLDSMLDGYGLAFEPVNIIVMGLFAILFLALCIPMTFFHAKRWFDLLIAACLTPFAMSAFLFRSTEKYFQAWLTTVKSCGMKQLAFAVLVSFLGLIMFATPAPTSFAGMVTKLILMLGGLYRLAFPPTIIKNLGSHSDSKTIADIYREIKRKKGDLDDTKDKTQKVSEDVLVKSAKVAGVLFRKFFR